MGPDAEVWSDRTGGSDPHNCALPREQHRYTFPSTVDGAPDGALGPLLGGNYHYLRTNIDPCEHNPVDTSESGSGSGSGSDSGDGDGVDLSFDVELGQCPKRGGFVGVVDADAEGEPHFLPPIICVLLNSFHHIHSV